MIDKREREGGREGGWGLERDEAKKRQNACVCVCVKER